MYPTHGYYDCPDLNDPTSHRNNAIRAFIKIHTTAIKLATNRAIKHQHQVILNRINLEVELEGKHSKASYELDSIVGYTRPPTKESALAEIIKYEQQSVTKQRSKH